MSIRLTVWLGAMASATLVLVAMTALETVLGSRLLAGVVVLMLFTPVAWLLARLAYHPVRDVTKTARSITTTGQLDRRCFYPGPRDDIGDLVVTVNELLVRYDAAIGRLRRLQAVPPGCTCPREEARPDPADLVVLDLLARDEPTGVSRPGS
jgi:hypothetical protein